MYQHLSVQRKRGSVETPTGANHVGDLAGTLASPAPGRPLEPATRAWLESAYGHDFANVQIHADSQADQLATSLHAAAFTTGNDIYFRESAYDVESEEGRHRLAHEAAHVVQQASGPVAGESGPDGVSVSHPADSFEQSADRAADSAISGAASRAAVSSSAPAQSTGGASVQRSLFDEGSDLLSGAIGGLAGLGQSAGNLLGGALGGMVGGPALAGLGASAGGWLGGAAGGAIDSGLGAAEGVGSTLGGLGSALGTGLPGLIASGAGGGLMSTIEDLF